ncbi:hypothetical protein P0F09_000695 [Vibrio metschnikovii]|uniref:hypothetical protein n=1 Tax=Vibrio metschnikovii TaxID=28172 RepID=UPI0028783924|nr:hypothetical protein [Vibrio metschnikovii]EKO3567069.1 hypothetical protein [Vibrio metschnikovii]EKO3602271.1 hypothetical protein [Vibrio metschnikovii]EKO3762934.1 hypothetical protein [Vibrio metschnikovii]EKQ5809718.1 hypothetical protein [Vibrio metschnikovii]
MSQMQRQYLRLEDITEKTRLTQGDVWEAVEQDKLPLCASIAASRLGAYAQDGKTIMAIFDYQGMVQLGSSVAKQFALALEPQTCQRMRVLQPELVKQWQTVSAAFPKVTQAGFAYQNQPINPPLQAFIASGEMNASLTQSSLIGQAGKTMNAIFSQLSDTLSDSLTEKQKAFAEQYPAKDEERLNIQPITINPTQLRVAVSDLVAVFGDQMIRMSDDAEVDTHPIKQIVGKVLSRYPDAKPRQVWELIRQDCESEAERQFDVFGKIAEMTDVSMTYFGLSLEAELNVSYEHFRRNLYGSVKKMKKAENKTSA